MIPVSVIVVTKNEERNITRCLQSLTDFSEVLVVDSHSSDKTALMVTACGAKLISFQWNGAYPKKRQWCLDNLELHHDWVFFVDADETITLELKNEIAAAIKEDNPYAGYFVTGRYLINGRILRFGQPNKKIALLHRRRMCFPLVDDLDIPGMGEIEGHYQPVRCRGQENLFIGTLKHFLVHDALTDERAWAFRHEKYARWEAGMNQKDVWPVDPISWRQKLKTALRRHVLRPHLMFLGIYIGCLGFLDGMEGLKFAIRRYQYYSLIQEKQKMLKTMNV
ncbi:MAG: glycosyltransferase family 2 protein [Pseudomonadota bacterium]